MYIKVLPFDVVQHKIELATLLLTLYCDLIHNLSNNRHINYGQTLSHSHSWFIVINTFSIDHLGATRKHDISVTIIMFFPFFHRYNDRNLANDIALLKLDTPVTMSEYVSPACLPDFPVQDATDCIETPVITGWGDTEGTGK